MNFDERDILLATLLARVRGVLFDHDIIMPPGANRPSADHQAAEEYIRQLVSSPDPLAYTDTNLPSLSAACGLFPRLTFAIAQRAEDGGADQDTPIQERLLTSLCHEKWRAH
jgi:hypothetical protein